MSNATYDAESIASNWLETRDSSKDLLPSNPCCLFTYEAAYDKSIPSREKTLQCKCGYCGKIFLISKHDAQDIIVKKRQHIFCSRSCSNRFKIKRHQPYQCKTCGKIVQPNEYYSSGRFCSEICARKYSSKFANSEKSIQKKKETFQKHYGAKLKSTKHKKKKYIPKKCRKIQFKPLASKKSTFSISTAIQSFNYNQFHIDIPSSLEGYIIEGAIFILLKMTEKWSLWDIKTILDIHDFKVFKNYCKSFLIEDNHIFIKRNPQNAVTISRRVLNKPLSVGSITIEERNNIAKECERLLYEEKWSTKKVCLEYLHCSTSKRAFLSVLGARTYTLSEALIIRYNISPEQRTAYKEYRRKCKFNFTKELEDRLFRADKLAIHDDIATKDHMVSVIYGFLHNIDPYLISHPANCMILPNISNSSKNGSCSITFDELVERVEWFNETILAKTEDYAKKYKNKRKHMLGNIFPIKEIDRLKAIIMIN